MLELIGRISQLEARIKKVETDVALLRYKMRKLEIDRYLAKQEKVDV